MGFIGIGGRNAGRQKDQAIFTSLTGPTIDRDDASVLRELLKPIEAKARVTPEHEIESLTVPRGDLRKRILDDSDFRRALRNLPVKIRDVNARRLEITDPVSADVYIKDTKNNGLKHTDGRSLIPFDIRMRALENWAGEWGYVRIPAAILLLMAGGLLYSAYKLATYAGKVVSEYSAATEAAIASDAGLEKAIRARSGTQPPEQRVAELQKESPAPESGAGVTPEQKR